MLRCTRSTRSLFPISIQSLSRTSRHGNCLLYKLWWVVQPQHTFSSEMHSYRGRVGSWMHYNDLATCLITYVSEFQRYAVHDRNLIISFKLQSSCEQNLLTVYHKVLRTATQMQYRKWVNLTHSQFRVIRESIRNTRVDIHIIIHCCRWQVKHS